MNNSTNTKLVFESILIFFINSTFWPHISKDGKNFSQKTFGGQINPSGDEPGK